MYVHLVLTSNLILSCLCYDPLNHAVQIVAFDCIYTYIRFTIREKYPLQYFVGQIILRRRRCGDCGAVYIMSFVLYCVQRTDK